MELLPIVLELAIDEHAGSTNTSLALPMASVERPYAALTIATRKFNDTRLEMRQNWEVALTLYKLGRSTPLDEWMCSALAQTVLCSPNLMRLIIAFAFPCLCATCGYADAEGCNDSYGFFRCGSCRQQHWAENVLSAEDVAQILSCHIETRPSYQVRYKEERVWLVEKTSLNGDSFEKVGELVWVGGQALAASMVNHVVEATEYTHMEDKAKQLKVNDAHKAQLMALEGNHAGTVLVELEPEGPGSTPIITQTKTWGL